MVLVKIKQKYLESCGTEPSSQSFEKISLQSCLGNVVKVLLEIKHRTEEFGGPIEL